MTTWIFDRYDTRWVGPITVTDNGLPITGYEVSVFAQGSRPLLWLPPDVEPGGTALGVLVGLNGTWTAPTTPGVYVIRVRLVDNPETETEQAGFIRTT